MKADLSIEDKKATIALNGDFTFDAHRDFKDATIKALEDDELKEIEIDFANVDYMDSAALGMLLLFNERASGRRISLANCKASVAAVLDIANFGKIFNIQATPDKVE